MHHSSHRSARPSDSRPITPVPSWTPTRLAALVALPLALATLSVAGPLPLLVAAFALTAIVA